MVFFKLNLEHGDRYIHFAKYLNKQGFAVFLMDFEGHGKSEGGRGEINNYVNLITDFSTFYDIVNETLNGDLFVFGQGIGAAVTLIYFEYNHPYLSFFEECTKGIVLCGCPFGITDPFFQNLKKAAALSKITPHTASCSYDYSFTKSIKAKKELEQDKLFIHEKIKCKTASQVLMMSEKLLEFFKKSKIPFYILHGDLDEIFSSDEAHKAFDENEINEDFKNLNIISELKHDLLHEDCYEAFFEEIVDWVKKLQSY